jgi:hypothetical protein
VEVSRAGAREAHDEDGRDDLLVGDRGEPCAVGDEAQTLREEPDDGVPGGSEALGVEPGLAVQCGDQDLERLPVRDVAEVVEPGLLEGGRDQLVGVEIAQVSGPVVRWSLSCTRGSAASMLVSRTRSAPASPTMSTRATPVRPKT